MSCIVLYLLLIFAAIAQCFILPCPVRRTPWAIQSMPSPESFEDEFQESQVEKKFGKGKVKGSQKARRFVIGDELHKLRHDVMAMRLELQEARRTGSLLLVRALEKAIMNAQQVDAEFIYTVSKERQFLAEENGKFEEAEMYGQHATEAKNALPQFGLEGLWVGKYGEHGFEMINVTYDGDVLIAQKVTGRKNVPKGQVSFAVDLSPKSSNGEVLEPIKLEENAAKEWGSMYLQRFVGKGQISAEGYHDAQWVDGQLILVNDYFSFAWLPIGHQVFFGRPSPELILKLMRDDVSNESGECSVKTFLEKCWEETQHIQDDHEVSEDIFSKHATSPHFFDQDDCFQ